MWKNKQALITAAAVAVLVLGGGGFWLVRAHHKPVVTQAQAGGTATNNVIPLGGQQTQDSSGGLNVTTGGASNLGQLGGKQTGQGSTAGTDSSKSSAPDPAQFAQYDKYKDAQSALFGDSQVGSGAELTAGKKAAVYYKGWLTNGQMFDQSRTDSSGNLQPFLFTLGAHEVIPGWEQGIYGMKAGGTRIIIVPPAVGYGASGQGSIPPNSVLVFQVQLLQVQ